MDLPPQKVLVVRLSAMGDVIHALPGVRALRQALPETEIGWVIEERWSELLCAKGYPREGPFSEQRPLVSLVHHVRTQAWRRNLFARATWKDFRNCFRELRAVRYDTALDLQGAIRSAVVASWSGARQVVGSAAPRESLARMFYNKTIDAAGTHVIEQAYSFLQGWDKKISALPDAILPRDPTAEDWCDQYCAELHPSKIVLMNPGAGWGAKQWPAERYGQVAQELASDGYTVLVNYGPGEGSLAQAVKTSSGEVARPVECSLGELIALTRRAALLVGGDTGPLHLAAALKIPVVAIYGPTNPARNGPFGTRSVILRSPESATSHKRHAQTESGMFHSTKDQVLAGARRVLQSEAI